MPHDDACIRSGTVQRYRAINPSGEVRISYSYWVSKTMQIMRVMESESLRCKIGVVSSLLVPRVGDTGDIRKGRESRSKLGIGVSLARLE